MGWIPWRYWNFCRIAWKAGMSLTGKSGMTGMSGKTGMSGMSGKTGMSGMSLEGLVGHTDGFLEDLLAFYV